MTDEEVIISPQIYNESVSSLVLELSSQDRENWILLMDMSSSICHDSEMKELSNKKWSNTLVTTVHAFSV